MSDNLNKLNLLISDFIRHLQKENNYDVIDKLKFIQEVVNERVLNRIVCGYNQLKSSFSFYQEQYRTEINYTYLIGHYINIHMKEKLRASYIDKFVFILELCATDPKHPLIKKTFNCEIDELESLISEVTASNLENKLVITSMTQQLIETISIDNSLLNKLVEK